MNKLCDGDTVYLNNLKNICGISVLLFLVTYWGNIQHPLSLDSQLGYGKTLQGRFNGEYFEEIEEMYLQ